MEFTGRTLGRYRLFRLLGFGGMGEVYLATSQGVAGFEKLVTVKLLRRQVSQNPERVSDLLREAFIGVRLDHENIVQVLDLGEQGGTYFLVMEYVRGFSLRELVSLASERRDFLPIDSAVHVMRCVADALEYVHRVRGPHRKHLGLIHRDVSPSNILLGAEGRIKLSDFGVSGIAQDTVRANAVIGKPKYLPPEAARGATSTQAWDVYALGVVLHSVLTGEPDVERVIGAPLRPIKDSRPDCPSSLVSLVERATMRDPDARITTATEFRKLLDEIMPRDANDVERWRDFVQTSYSRDDFVSRYGVLPHVEDLVPELMAAPSAQTSVAYVETVVVDSDKPLRFGLSPALGLAAARGRADRFATWLRRRLDRDVRPVVLADYRALVDALAEGEVDFAWMPPVSFVAAAERGAGIVALAQRFGRPTYESGILVRNDSPIKELADLRGRSIAFVDRDSASGYLFAADLIARNHGPIETFVGAQHFQGSHQSVCEAVVRGWIDAGTTYVVRDLAGEIVHAGWLELAPEMRTQVRPIAFTNPIPGDNLAHRPGLSTGVIERLARSVVDLDTDDEESRTVLADVFGTTSMVRGDLRIYDAVRETLRRVSPIPGDRTVATSSG